MLYKLLLALVVGLTLTHAQPAAPDREAYMKWFDEARFGMFIHWGVYAVPAGEWQGKQIGGIGEWILKTGKIPVADYKKFASKFTDTKYDPVAIAKLAKAAGMKYVVITSKHHDGFALYDSAVSDWDVMQSGAKRDLIAPLAEAVRAEGLKFGLYYSQAQDWIHQGGGVRGEKWDPAQKGDYDQYLKNIALPQVKEIVSRYNPAILWWDTPTNMTPERVKPFTDFMATHPEIINNNRLGDDRKGDTKTPEQHIPPRGYPGERFEVCMTMNNTWGFKKNDRNWKSVQQILFNLSDISSKGGNFLLNIGPTAEGLVPQESIDRLLAVGEWMKVNQEAIYGTTASPFARRLPWGRVTQKISGEGTTLYLHVWKWPANQELLLPTLKELPTQGKVLATGAKVTAKNSHEGLLISLPASAPDANVSVLRLDFPSAIKVTMEPFLMPDKDGRITFDAQEADAHGTHSGSIQLRNTGADNYLTDWNNSSWSLEYRLKTTKAQKWLITGEFATPNGAKLNLMVGKIATPAEIPATGKGLVWKTVTLGTIELPAGETGFQLNAVKEGWKGLSVRNVWLTPAP
jgi:alpha-L-fucosidase